MGAIARDRLGLNPTAAPPALAAFVVCAVAVAVSASGVVATSAGVDQRQYHWVTIQYFREIFPRIDIVNVDTATGPLYHLIVAAVSGPLHLGEFGTQCLSSFFAAGLAALAVWYVGIVTEPVLRVLAVAPLLLSPYFWESALWMLTDAAALLFAFAAFVLLLRRESMDGVGCVSTGLLLAAAVATRQTYVWSLVPAMAVIWYQHRESGSGTKLLRVLAVAAPALVVLAGLVALWHGFLPPRFHEMNAANRSWLSPTYCAAVAAVFFVPISLATYGRGRPRLSTTLGAGAAVALPALVWTSSATTGTDNARRGGLIWESVEHTPLLDGRSLLLTLLAFAGGCSICHVLLLLDNTTAILIGTGLVSLAATMTAGGQLYQKYFELPVAAMALIAICALAANGAIERRWPLVGLAALQALLTAALVAGPVITAP